MTSAFITIPARLLAGGLLLYAGITKLNHGWEFAEIISNFKLLPPQLNQLAAVVLPWNEVAAGLLLILGLWTRSAALLSTLLFLLFGAAVASALARGLNIDCGCFGAVAHKADLTTLLIDAAGLTASLVVLCVPEQRSHAKAQRREEV